MQSLQEKASLLSGVDQTEAFAIDDSNLFDKLGLQTFINLSTNFYTRVYDDEEEWFRSIFSNSNKEGAIQNQYEFFVQRMGGPPLYSRRKGHPALIGRHRPFPVTHQAAERWLHHMQNALDDSPDIGQESKIKMMNFFRHTAFFLVAGNDLKNQTEKPKHKNNSCSALRLPQYTRRFEEYWSFPQSYGSLLSLQGHSSIGDLTLRRLQYLLWAIERRGEMEITAQKLKTKPNNGRRRCLSKLKFGNAKEKYKAQRQAGSAADIIKIAMIKYILQFPSMLIPQHLVLHPKVHDELVLEVDPSYAKEATILLLISMEKAVSLLGWENMGLIRALSDWLRLQQISIGLSNLN